MNVAKKTKKRKNNNILEINKSAALAWLCTPTTAATQHTVSVCLASASGFVLDITCFRFVCCVRFVSGQAMWR